MDWTCDTTWLDTIFELKIESPWCIWRVVGKRLGTLTTSCHEVRVATTRGSGARHSNRGADIRIRAACMLSEGGKWPTHAISIWWCFAKMLQSPSLADQRVKPSLWTEHFDLLYMSGHALRVIIFFRTVWNAELFSSEPPKVVLRYIKILQDTCSST